MEYINRLLHRHSPNTSAPVSPEPQSGNEATTIKGDQQQPHQQHQQQPNHQHDVKVRFIREFADAGGSTRDAATTESSLSSASSFQSLASTLSSKCSSGICVDSSPAKITDASYLSPEIPGLDDLISGCEKIRLTDVTLDRSIDQSFSLHLDGDDLSGDQTFTSAVDRESPDRNRETEAGNSPNATRDLNGSVVEDDREISTANAYFECASVENAEATRFLPVNSSGIDAVDEAFVQCVSNLGEIVESTKAAEILDARSGNLGILAESLGNVGNSTILLEEFAGKSTTTLESLADLIVEEAATTGLKDVEESADSTFELKETADEKEVEKDEKRGEAERSAKLDVNVDFLGESKELGVDEEPAQKLLDVTVDLKSDLREIETGSAEIPVAEITVKSAENQLDVTVDLQSVAENPVESQLDVTVDLQSDLKEIENVESTEIRVAENPVKSQLDVTVDLQSDLKEIENVESTEIRVAENPVESQLDLTVDLQSDLKEIENVASRRSEVAENLVKSQLDVTVDFPGDPQEIQSVANSNEVAEKPSILDVTVDLKEVNCLQLSNFNQKEPNLPEFSSNLDAKVQSSESHDFNEESQCPSLPTLSSVCLQTTSVESEARQLKKSPDEFSVPAIVAPSLSEKFANIAANETSPGNSISTVKEPTFLNAQKLVDDSIELVDDGITEAANTEFVPHENLVVQTTRTEFSDFKKPEAPAARVAIKVSSPESPKAVEKIVAESADKFGANKGRGPEIFDNCDADSSRGSQDLDETVAIQDISAGNIFAVAESDQYAEFQPTKQSTSLASPKKFVDSSTTKPVSLPNDYADFLPNRQSTTLGGLERQPTPFVVARSAPEEATFNGERNTKSPRNALPVDDRCNFEKLELAARAVANDIYNTSLELEDESSGQFVSATSEAFYDPGSFDFLLSKTPRKNTRRDLRAESLYVKFDPLVSNTSMLPQGNIQNASPPANAERNGDDNATITNIGTPKRSSAIAAIDKLLFYSPMTTNAAPTSNAANIQKTNDSQEKSESTEETSAETVNMAKELELVRSTVLQLEEQLEKLKIDHEEALEKQSSYQEKINQLQTQLAQEIKNKNQITVVVDEYEKSISRLVAERERDRKNLDLEKAKLQEELAAAKHHLDNTEAAFNDVHLKYERLKAVVSTYKNNEAMLKQSIQENVEIIKSLENRYEQVKEHATARLEKANQDLDAIRKQNESETVKLHAMLRKAELKSNSLAELVEQKTKENKELTQILDEVIARVGRKQSE